MNEQQYNQRLDDVRIGDVMTVSQAAKELGLSVQGIRFRLERGLMVGNRVHERLWLIPRTEVERWKEIGKVQGQRNSKSVEGACPDEV